VTDLRNTVTDVLILPIIIVFRMVNLFSKAEEHKKAAFSTTICSYRW